MTRVKQLKMIIDKGMTADDERSALLDVCAQLRARAEADVPAVAA